MLNPHNSVMDVQSYDWKMFCKIEACLSIRAILIKYYEIDADTLNKATKIIFLELYKLDMIYDDSYHFEVYYILYIF